MKGSKKVAIITGAGRGIGLAVAKKLKNRFSYLILLTKTKKSSERLKEEFPKAEIIRVDLTREKEIIKFLKEIKSKLTHLDLLVNNAGFYLCKPFEETVTDEFDYQYFLHMRAPFILIKKLLPLLRKAKSPLVVNISSAASIAHFRNESVYTAVKAGLTALIEVIREELQKDNIRFTVIHPYGVNTWNDPYPDRLLRPEDIAELIYYLTRTHSNCQILRVDLSSVKQWRQGVPPWLK